MNKLNKAPGTITEWLNSHLWQALAFGCGLLWFAFFINVIPTGDDLAYAATFKGTDPYYDGNLMYYPRWVLRHWYLVNGRLGNYAAPFVTILPAFLRAALVGAGIWALFYMAVKASRLPSGWGPCGLLAAMAFGLPWWDAFTLIDVHANYTWSAVLVLIFYVLFTGRRHVNVWLGGAVSVLAGCCHEAAGLPVLCAVILLFIINRRSPDRYHCLLLICFGAGVAAEVLSPGLLGRAASNRQPDDTPFWLLLKSDIIALVLWCAIAIAAVFRAGRRYLAAFFREPVSILAWAALASSVISASTGIVGRSGFFAEVFALIVIFNRASLIFHKKAPVLSLVLTALVFVQLGTVVAWQWRYGGEQREAYAGYLDSTDGVVYMHITPDDAQPAWITLNIPHGVPDSDDLYNNYAMTLFHPEGIWPYIIDPDDAELRARDSITEPMHRIDNPWHEIYYIRREGALFTVEPFGDCFLVRRLVLDPGDRL